MLEPYLVVAETKQMGRGVFTLKSIAADTVIEVSPVIVMSKAEREFLDKTLLYNYIFEWGKEKERCCMALGLIPIYNHSYESNCEYFMDFEKDTILVRTVRKIDKGEELTINYNGDWNDPSKVWFETAAE
jgi:SET domain-containing protein